MSPVIVICFPLCPGCQDKTFRKSQSRFSYVRRHWPLAGNTWFSIFNIKDALYVLNRPVILTFFFQVIKNSDLEELKELGSGTFGTVYHGKWRGTDVAIKRVNDRCFAGKPSEQDRMVVFVF